MVARSVSGSYWIVAPDQFGNESILGIPSHLSDVDITSSLSIPPDATCPKPSIKMRKDVIFDIPFLFDSPAILVNGGIDQCNNVTISFDISPATLNTKEWTKADGGSAISATQVGSYNVIQVRVNIAAVTQLDVNSYSVESNINDFDFKLPTLLTSDATRYALKMFKLSDNDFEGDISFSAVVKGGLAGTHLLQFPFWTPGAGSPALTCTVHSDIIVDCAPFFAGSPTVVSGS